MQVNLIALKYINPGWCRYVTSTETGMEQLEMEKGEWLGECFAKCLGERFVHASVNALQNASLSVSDNGLKNT